MRNLFGRPKPDPDSTIIERWETGFFWKHLARFKEEATDRYEALIRGRALHLTLKRRNLFAWVNDPFYRYRDFVLDAEINLPSGQPHSSAGLLFRYVNESTYYYLLVSTRGYFRFDVVFNGNPMRLIEWTELPAEPTETFRLRVIANGSRFTFCYNDEWIAEIDDDTVDAGGVAFGAQNYDEGEQATASMQHLVLDSRGIEIETQHYRWRETVTVEPESRLRLARTLFTGGNATAAIIQIRKASHSKRPDADSLFLLAECQVSLGLHASAIENIEKALAFDPDRLEAQREKANLLYLLGRYLELRDYLDGRVESSESSTLWNLSGHAHFSLGNWAAAATAYTKASELEPGMPLFHVNSARAYEHLAQRQKALEHYVMAGRLFVRQDAVEELAQIIPSIKSLDPANREARIFEGTIAFRNGNLPEAERHFDEVVNEGGQDSAVLYMLGIIRSRQGDRRSALELFTRAAELEPEFSLYWFRLAETRYLLGEDPADALDRALRLAPDDPWTLNLAGQVWLDTGRAGEAAETLRRAAERAPEEVDIIVNYAEALFRSGSEKEAVELLEGRKEPEALNTLGNVFTRMSRAQDALAAYERAYEAAPDDPIICENLAAACIESDLVRRAEELLGRLMETAPSPSVMNRVGNLARIEGDFVRAETAYRQALELLSIPDIDAELSQEQLDRLSADTQLNTTVAEIEYNLADLYQQWFRSEFATKVAERMRLHAVNGRARELAERIRLATQVQLACSHCGREWWAPKRVDVPPVLRLQGEPPGDSPAGRCEKCGRVYCVGCAVEHLRGDHFVCPFCDEFLKLNDDHLKYLVLKAVEISQKGHP